MKTELFQIPFQDKFIVYGPLKRTAFLANRAMVESIAGLVGKNGNGKPKSKAMQFIKRTRILDLDPKITDEVPLRYQPLCIVLFLTNQCNLRCIYCYAKGGELPSARMRLELACKAIDIGEKNALDRKADAFEVSFHGGGEPSLNWETLKRIVAYARKKRVRAHVSASSNGCFNGEKRDFVVNNFDGLSLSFDGPQDIQDRQRPTKSGNGSFGVVMRTIKELDRHSFPYRVRMTVTRDSARSLARMVSFVCNETGAESIQVEPAFPRGRGMKQALTNGAVVEFLGQFQEAYSIASAGKRDFFYSGATLAISNRFCSAATEALVVLPEGQISACFEITNPVYAKAKEFILGKIGKDKVVFNEPLWRKIAGRSSDRIGYCEDCFCRWHCAGDCLSKTFCSSRKDRFSPSWRCRINQDLTKFLLLEKISQNNGIWLGQ
jgi:uncharacterized protein